MDRKRCRSESNKNKRDSIQSQNAYPQRDTNGL
jgi:hypothetical protein